MNTKKQKGNMILSLIILLGIIALICLIGFFMMNKKDEIIQGQADASEYRISSKIPGRILKLHVKEGDKVKKGDTLVELEAPDIMAKLDQVNALKSAANAQYKKAENGTRYEKIQIAFEMWQKSKAGLQIMLKSYVRFSNLYNEGVIPAQKFDEITAQRDAAIATERAASSQYQMAKNGAQKEDKLAAKAILEQSEGAIKEIVSYVKETILIAQTDGEVSEIFPELGELVGTGAPIMNITINQDMWVSFNVREDLLNSMTIGDEFNAEIPALNNKIVKLKVSYIKDMGTYAAWKATKPTGQYDLKTFEVKARPLSHIQNLRAGMSVILKIKR